MNTILSKLIRGSENKNLVAILGPLCLLLALGTSALAESTVASVTVGEQTPYVVLPGSNAVSVVTVTRTGTGNLDVYLSVIGLPAGAQVSFSPSPVHFSGSSVMSATANMVITAGPSTRPGTYPLVIKATDGGSHNVVSCGTVLQVGLTKPGVVKMPDGCALIGLQAPKGKACCIEAATNIWAPVWTYICTTNSGTNVLMVMVDEDAPKYPCRFYRLSVP